MLKKYSLDQCNAVDIPMVERSKLDEDPNGTPVDFIISILLYRSMVGSLMFLTASRPDLVFVVCMCARYHPKPTEKHLIAIKRVFRYLKGTINISLWYPKDTGFDLMDFSNTDHTGCQDSRKSTSSSAQFLACVDIIWKLLVHQELRTKSRGLPMGIHGLFSGWYYGLASRKVTLVVSMASAKGCALSLDKLAMPPHFHKKFRMGVAIAKGCRGYYKPGTRAWVRRGSRKIRIPIDMYPCRVEERLTIKLVKGEEVLKIETTVTAKDGTITKFLGKFPEYKPTKEEEEISKLKAMRAPFVPLFQFRFYFDISK
ncbi:hypothetical protein Tco_0232389 [Tanacetum coccineum]